LLLPDDDNDVGQGWGTNILIRVAKADIVACYFLMMIMMWVGVVSSPTPTHIIIIIRK
jgi:hypothetical protein